MKHKSKGQRVASIDRRSLDLVLPGFIPGASRVDLALSVEVDAGTWQEACEQARRGDVALLAHLLRETDMPVSPGARALYADLLTGNVKISRRHKYRSLLDSVDRMKIRWAFSWLEHRWPARSRRTKRARLAEVLARIYNVTPGTIYDVAARRGKYSDK